MMEFNLQPKSTITARKRRTTDVKETTWKDLWDNDHYKSILVNEIVPVAELFDRHKQCIFYLKEGETLYKVTCDDKFCYAWFAEIFYNYLKRDESFFDVLKSQVQLQRQELSKLELKKQIHNLAQIKFNALPSDSDVTYESLVEHLSKDLDV